MEQFIKELQTLVDKLKNTKEVTLDEKFALDEEIMQLQFIKSNEVFEKLRDTLELIDVVDVVEEPEGIEPDEEPPLYTAEELKDKYSVGELKKILKDGGVSGYSKLKEDELIELILKNKLV